MLFKTTWFCKSWNIQAFWSNIEHGFKLVLQNSNVYEVLQYTVLNCTYINDREAVWICIWHWMSKYYTYVTITNRLCVSDHHRYSIMIFCPIAKHLCMTLALIIFSTFKLCERGVCDLARCFFHFSLFIFWPFISSMNARWCYKIHLCIEYFH